MKNYNWKKHFKATLLLTVVTYLSGIWITFNPLFFMEVIKTNETRGMLLATYLLVHACIVVYVQIYEDESNNTNV
jgi:hypothetical protein